MAEHVAVTLATDNVLAESRLRPGLKTRKVYRTLKK